MTTQIQNALTAAGFQAKFEASKDISMGFSGWFTLPKADVVVMIEDENTFPCFRGKDFIARVVSKRGKMFPPRTDVASLLADLKKVK